MNMTPTQTQTFEVGDLTNFQCQTFSGNIEFVEHDENTIKMETFFGDRNLLTFYGKRNRRKPRSWVRQVISIKVWGYFSYFEASYYGLS